MTISTILIVLFAALLHAAWNAIVKIEGERLITMTLVSFGAAIFSFIAVLFLPLPDIKCWPYLILTLFCHFGYKLSLISAYSLGDFSQVYPLSRGVAPLIVTIFAICFMNEKMTILGGIAIFVIVTGIVILSFKQNSDDNRSYKHLVFALLTSVFIASYTLIDGTGGRKSQNVNSYIAWLMMLDALPMFVVSFFKHGRKTFKLMKKSFLIGVCGGAMSLIAYWLVISCMSTDSIPIVSALRETSVIFAAIIGAFILKEDLGIKRMCSVIAIVLGIILLKSGNNL